MTDTAVEGESAKQLPVPVPSSTATDEQLIAMLVDRARNKGLQLSGEGGLLQQLTKRALESAMEGEITDHVGYDKHDATGRNSGNSRNGTRAKTVLTDVGPVEVKVPRVMLPRSCGHLIAWDDVSREEFTSGQLHLPVNRIQCRQLLSGPINEYEEQADQGRARQRTRRPTPVAGFRHHGGLIR
jgi:hypothetical protein